jgi:hypothetical protein
MPATIPTDRLITGDELLGLGPLRGEGVLEGFSLPVATLFAE